MKVRCAVTSCGKIFEAPNWKTLHAWLPRIGWCYRGSQNGLVYYCDEHPPQSDG